MVEAHIRRIEEVNSRLNAVVIPLFEQARKEAEAFTAAQRRGDSLGPLHGVPITIKEQFLVKGTTRCFGVLNLKNHRAAEDGPLVKRLRDAGAIYSQNHASLWTSPLGIHRAVRWGAFDSPRSGSWLKN